jgi:P27 family predicted phage terminase small subunit
MVPPAPPGLNEDGEREWGKLTRELIALGVFTSIDDSMLYAYCKEFGKYLHYERELSRLGRTVKSKTGFLFVHPFETLANRSLKAAFQIAVQFGLTPSARTRISAPSKPKEDDFDKV